VAFVPMRFVFDAKAVGRERLAQLFRDEIASQHGFTSLEHDLAKA
jgi:hypothetical protein